MITILTPGIDDAHISRLTAPSSGLRLIDAWSEARTDLEQVLALSGSGELLTSDETVDVRYVVFPWRAAIVKLPAPHLFHLLRTTRNRFLITDDEQDRWSAATIAVAGLSVGGSVLHTCALTGARRFRVADLDTLGISNLNRLAGSVCDLGAPKVELAHRRLLELDPYAQVETFPTGYSDAVAAEFLGGATPPAVVFEEMDDVRRKVELRIAARAARLPVVMVTDDGDDVIVDVERYDLDGDYPLFHGRAGDIVELGADVLDDPANKVAIAGAIVGDGVTERMRMSLAEVGRTIPSWPQLGSAATLAGAVGAAVGRRIVLGEDMPSGRRHVRSCQ
ncbi:ThiF family adenylyltransferase [Gordonia sp. (in: high G+C Gram-positive bacteria)]|uniref:ThiF family adenylyltransferase n=1 Tax=Gordonia sp. (in: high G+C Gram-positive bacteria) TaxID=84139 RepID=UPI003C72DFFE